MDWVTHDCGGEMTEEGEIRLRFQLQADRCLLMLWTGHQCIQTTTSMTATAPGSSLHLSAKWSRSSESKGLHKYHLCSSTKQLCVFIRFDVLQLEASRGCRYDYIAIYEGNRINNTQLLGNNPLLPQYSFCLGKYCGNQTAVPPIRKSHGRQLVLQFK